MNENNKKVYILNYWWCANYGACLTAYALYNLISNKGFPVELLDNMKWYEKLFYNFSFSKKFFKDKCKVSKSFYKDDKFLKETATFITGSDQVFNPELIGDKKVQYMLDFVNIFSKKISFSASFGLTEKQLLDFSTPEMLEQIKHSLKSFDFISVRENSAQKICNEVFDVNADWIIDPVFILDKSYYDIITRNVKQDYSDKIVSYCLSNKKEYQSVCDHLAQKYNSPVIEIATSNLPVENWLCAIKNCKFLITNSFHAVCFAIIFNKPFICLAYDKQAYTRFESIFQMLNIQNKSVKNIKEIYNSDCIFKPDYNKINAKIQLEAQKGDEFLETALNNSCNINIEKYISKNYYLENELIKIKNNKKFKNKLTKITNEIWSIWLLLYPYLPKGLRITISLIWNKFKGGKRAAN